MIRRIKIRILTLITMIYLYFPVFVFLITWTRLYIAVPASLFAVYGIYTVYKNTDKDEDVQYHLSVVIVYLLIVVILSIYSGWGGFLVQHYDWNKHNAVLSDLIEYDYPVYYQNGSEKSMLTYYIGIYLIPGLMGKTVGFRMAHLIMCSELWGFAILVYLNILRITKSDTIKRELLVCFSCICFNFPMLVVLPLKLLYKDREGIDFNRLGLAIENLISEDKEYDLILQVRGLYIAYAMFPAYLPIAVTTVLYYVYREKLNCYTAIWVPAILYCLMALPYIILIAVIMLLIELIKNKNPDVKKMIIQNIVNILPSIPLILYFSGNVFSVKDKSIGLSLQCLGKDFFIALIFFILTIMPYIILVYKTNKTDPLFYLTGAFLFVSMFISMGRFNDLMITGTIPLAVLIMIMICKTFSDKKICKKGKAVLLIVILVATFPLCFFNKTVSDYKEVRFIEDNDQDYDTVVMLRDGFRTYGSMKQFANRSSNHESDLKYNYFTYDYEEKLFFKFLARK